MSDQKNPVQVEQWGVFAWTLQGPCEGNPYLEVQLEAAFTQGDHTISVTGFYDGDDCYRIRFMPDRQGFWTAVTESNRPALNGMRTEFQCVPPQAGNHGPIRADAGKGLCYADGTPYACFGTTCYAWIHQGEALAQQTLESLRSAPFDKLRMTLFPKSYRYNENNDPQHFVFPVLHRGRTTWDGHWDNRDADSDWQFDMERFDPAFFGMLETRILQLMEAGIEADLILFHPYDRWGFARMPREVDLRYLDHVLARLSAYRNVWWSLANEFDFMRGKSDGDWEAIGSFIAAHDPYRHMTGIHNGARWFDHSRPWITHCSVQTSQFDIKKWSETYTKPIVVDEMCYEGNISEGWGNISAREMVHRFWEVAAAGGYPGHSEVCLTPEHVMWWNKGGVLRGESPARIAFLKGILMEAPPVGTVPCPENIGGVPGGKRGDTWFLGYTGVRQPLELWATLQPERQYRLTHLDTWNMTRLPGGLLQTGTDRRVRIPLTGKPHMAFMMVCES